MFSVIVAFLTQFLDDVIILGERIICSHAVLSLMMCLFKLFEVWFCGIGIASGIIVEMNFDSCAYILVGSPRVLSVRPNPDFNSLKKYYSLSSGQEGHISNSKLQFGINMLFHVGNSKHWLVRIDKPGVGVVTKAQIVDYYVQIMTKIMGK